MNHGFVPGHIIHLDGKEFYEIMGYGIDGRLLIEKSMVPTDSLEAYDAFLDSEIQRQLDKQSAVANRRIT